MPGRRFARSARGEEGSRCPFGALEGVGVRGAGAPLDRPPARDRSARERSGPRGSVHRRAVVGRQIGVDPLHRRGIVGGAGGLLEHHLRERGHPPSRGIARSPTRVRVRDRPRATISRAPASSPPTPPRVAVEPRTARCTSRAGAWRSTPGPDGARGGLSPGGVPLRGRAGHARARHRRSSARRSRRSCDGRSARSVRRPRRRPRRRATGRPSERRRRRRDPVHRRPAPFATFASATLRSVAVVFANTVFATRPAAKRRGSTSSEVLPASNSRTALPSSCSTA